MLYVAGRELTTNRLPGFGMIRFLTYSILAPHLRSGKGL